MRSSTSWSRAGRPSPGPSSTPARSTRSASSSLRSSSGLRRPGPPWRAPGRCESPTGYGRSRPTSSRSERTCSFERGSGSGEALMFTGIIKELGTVETVEASDDGARLRIRADLTSELHPGDSVAVNGACLTATSVDDGEFGADVMHQTLSLTTLGALEGSSRVNLELPLRPADRLGGHMVQGHVD